jgi:hypothetical protein
VTSYPTGHEPYGQCPRSSPSARVPEHGASNTNHTRIHLGAACSCIPSFLFVSSPSFVYLTPLKLYLSITKGPGELDCNNAQLDQELISHTEHWSEIAGLVTCGLSPISLVIQYPFVTSLVFETMASGLKEETLPTASSLPTPSQETSNETEGAATSPTSQTSAKDGFPDEDYPPQRTVILVMAAIFMTTFLVALDRTIIATAIPKITDQFHSLGDIGW